MPRFTIPVVLALALALSGCASFRHGGGVGQCGEASWYELTSRTASGEMANPNAMAAAHRTLPFGTVVRVYNLANGRSADVRINDRGPYVNGRVIDVTRAAAQALGFQRQGITDVKLTVLSAPVSEIALQGPHC